ncbi:MAG: radical SAM protein [Candidatus Omnitrophica bacterium]|nr:radical SAM protein [Candidatus Omnitrophota bacterium]
MLKLWLRRKKKKIATVLVMCPAWGVLHPPANLAYLKAFLAGQGLGVKCFDFNVELYEIFPQKKFWDLNYPEYFIIPHLFSRHIYPVIEKHIDDWAHEILQDDPATVGFSLYMSTVNVSVLLAKKLKGLNPHMTLVAGGAEVNRIKKILIEGVRPATPLNRELFEVFDLLIDGEGEDGLYEICRRKDKTRGFHDVPGIVYASTEKLCAMPPRPLIHDLDSIPFPVFDDFILKKYITDTLPLVTSRGCVNRCAFCADSPLWKTYRCMSAEKVVADMKTLAARYRMNDFEIVDSTFNGDISRVEDMCDLILQKRLKVRWSAKAIVRKEMDFRLLEKMRRAGCVSLAYGIESGSESILKDMGKTFSVGLAEKVIRDTHDAGISANTFFLIGFPTETDQDFQKTIVFMKRNARFIQSFAQVTGCHIEEGSSLGMNPERWGIRFEPDGWYSEKSTPAVRKQRLEEFRKVARQVHRHYVCEVQG